MSFLSLARTEFTCRLRNEPPHILLLVAVAISTSAGLVSLWLSSIVIPQITPTFGAGAFFGVSNESWRVAVAGNRGGALFCVLSVVFATLALVVAPITAGATFNRERDGRALETLLLTGLSPLTIVLGKHLAAFARCLLVLAGATPTLAVAWLFGGASPQIIALSAVFIITFAFLSGVIALFMSSAIPSNLAALLSSYALLAVLTLSGPAAFLVLAARDAGPQWLPLLYPNPPIALLSLQPDLIAAFRSLLPFEFRDPAMQLGQSSFGFPLPYPFFGAVIAGYLALSTILLAATSVVLDPYHPLRNLGAVLGRRRSRAGGVGATHRDLYSRSERQ